nr:hypothetical protein GCM10025732_58090 [Glycomyces mayteni]
MAVLAATSTGRSLAEVSAWMTATGDTVEPDASRHRALTDLYLRFTDHLHERGRIDRSFNAHVHRRAEH